MKIFILLLLSLAFQLQSQELNCRVMINQTGNTTSVPPSVFKNLERAISEFLNNRKWTDETTAIHQKINCNLTINIMSVVKQDVYTADLVVQSERPVFNTTMNTPILRHPDRGIPFEYQENQPLDFSEQVFFSNLTSILGFYAHLIIAMDNETFGLKGGQAEFEKCQNIANLVPVNHSIGGQLATGWTAAEAQDIKGQRTRIGLLLEHLKSSSEPYRSAIYKYHFQGLDMMEGSPEKAIENIEKAIEEIGNNYNNHYLYKHFVGAKAEEVMGAFKSSPAAKKTKIKDILLRIEPNVSDRLN